MSIVTGDRYLEKLVKFLEEQAEPLIEGTEVLKLNPAGLHYVHLRLDALQELELMLSGAPVDYLRAYVSDLGDYRALEQLRRILRLLTSLKVVSALPPPARDPTPLALLPFGRLKVLELRGCDLSTSAAKGLLELRHTLEKIVCHNSTDALRHVFASRIAEIKDSPQWNKLSFVSCACNRLVLMDESMQLLPAVETLDLSRNKFAKVDNLGRCTKLKHLDLGFNHLRTILHFGEVSCHIVKLVLRNNALTSLRGIENLKSLEELDVSYNIISNFSELEFLGALSQLRNLWLEGNPLCCARWYRAQVFSYFVYPHNLKLDSKEIGTRGFWKRQIIIARRQKRLASFGFYSPAKDDAEGEWSDNRKKKKVYRLASIGSEEESPYVCSDQESASCDQNIRSKEENVKSEDEAEIVDLINKVEHLKKERSVLWLRDFKEWMDHSSEDLAVAINHYWGIHPEEKNFMKIKKNQMHRGESSRYAIVSAQASGDEGNTIMLHFDDSFAGLPTALRSVPEGDANGTLKTTGEIPSSGTHRLDPHLEYKNFSPEDMGTLQPKSLPPETIIMEGQGTAENDSTNVIDDMMGPHSSSVYLGSPPHYQKDVLRRRHNVVEETLQLSADSYSAASSDSITSCSEDEIYESEQSIREDNQLAYQEFLNKTKEQHFISGIFEDKAHQQEEENPGITQNDACLPGSQPENASSIIKNVQSLISGANNFFTRSHGAELASFVNQNVDWFEKRKSGRKPKKKVVSLLAENHIVVKGETWQRSDLDVCGASSKDECNGCFTKQIRENDLAPLSNNDGRYSGVESTRSGRDDLVKKYFREKVADSRIEEICRLYMLCECILEQDSTYDQREVVLLLSSENALYVLLACSSLDRPGTSFSLWGTHRVEDVQDISVGLGLQVVRLQIGEGAKYLFIANSIEKSTELLHLLQVCYSQAAKAKCTLRSLEHLQVELFEKQICGGLKLSIFQYTVLHFQCSTVGEESWLPRSLFVAGGHLFICIEDFKQFGSLPVDSSSASYFSLHTCCSISDVSEVVIESKKNASLSLAIEQAASEFSPSIEPNGYRTANNRRKRTGGLTIWKLKWFSEQSLFKFVALLKALHSETTRCSLLTRHLD